MKNYFVIENKGIIRSAATEEGFEEVLFSRIVWESIEFGDEDNPRYFAITVVHDKEETALDILQNLFIQEGDLKLKQGQIVFKKEIFRDPVTGNIEWKGPNP